MVRLCSQIGQLFLPGFYFLESEVIVDELSEEWNSNASGRQQSSSFDENQARGKRKLMDRQLKHNISISNDVN